MNVATSGISVANSRHLTILVVPIAVLQQTFVKFSGIEAGPFVFEIDRPGNLGICQMPLRIRQDFGGQIIRRLDVRARPYASLELLPALVDRYAHNADPRHVSLH